MISRIQVSIDAINSETYDKIRVGGNYNKVLANIAQLMSYKKEKNIKFPFLRVNFLSLPENNGQENLFLDYWKDKSDAVAIQRSVLKPDSSRTQGTEKFTLKERFCPNPFRQIVVRADMTILPCCSFWGCELALGEFNNEQPSTFFKSKKMRSIQSTFEDKNSKLLNPCKNCLSSCDPTF